MRVLALNPYHGGSHAAFLNGWVARSRHTITPLTLPGHHWKWRMRHAAETFATQAADPSVAIGEPFGGVWCTSMLDLAAFRGLAPPAVAALPCHLYFHENQLTYPTRDTDGSLASRDHHFAVTHATSALAALRSGGSVAFNSAFHRDGFVIALRKLLRKMPGRELVHAADWLEQDATVRPPGVDVPPRPNTPRAPGPLRVLWAARWEHDKDPDAFFAAVRKLVKRGVDIRISVRGESFEQVPECFTIARERFADIIDDWGFAEDRAAYHATLHRADVFVSTARHEFFGLAAIEAVAAGCFPVLPHRLAYPGVFGENPRFYYGGTPETLADRLADLAAEPPSPVPEAVARYAWPAAAAALDDGVAAGA